MEAHALQPWDEKRPPLGGARYRHYSEFFGTVEQVLTLVIKLQVGSEQRQLLSDTCTAFASACNWINENVNPRLTNRNSIQAVCYKDVKEKFGLTANHVVRACGRVAANRLTAKQKGRKVKNFAPTSCDCDARTFRFVEKDWAVTVSTRGQQLTLPLRASDYHRGNLPDRILHPLKSVYTVTAIGTSTFN